MSDDLTTQERIMLYDAHKERDELRARLADTERQLREAQERCERLEGALREYADKDNWGYYDGSGCPKGEGRYTDACFVGPDVARAALSEPDEMTQQEGKA